MTEKQTEELDADSRERWIRHSARAVEGPDGRVRFYQGLVEDASELAELRADRDPERS